MNNLSRDKQVEIIGMLCEGVGQRAVARLTNTDRKTVARLALAVGTGADCVRAGRLQHPARSIPRNGWSPAGLSLSTH
jgi:hypothetical protein